MDEEFEKYLSCKINTAAVFIYDEKKKNNGAKSKVSMIFNYKCTTEVKF